MKKSQLSYNFDKLLLETDDIWGHSWSYIVLDWLNLGADLGLSVTVWIGEKTVKYRKTLKQWHVL